MPINPRTGKTDRHASTKEELLEFRTKQAEKERAAGVKKGKQRARGSPDAEEPEASKSVPSPSTTLAGLGGLSLESGGPSAGSPATQDPPPERPAPAPSTAPKARRISRRSAGKSVSKTPVTAHTQHSSGFAVEVPTRSQLLSPNAVHLQDSRSHSDASPASDDGSFAVRLQRLEQWARGIDELVKHLRS